MADYLIKIQTGNGKVEEILVEQTEIDVERNNVYAYISGSSRYWQ